MLKVVCVTAVMTVGLVSHAHADAFRPGASPAGGRIGKVCNSDFLSRSEQLDCIEKMKAAKTDAERKEIRDVIRQNQKERQEEADRANARVNPGGPGTTQAVQ
jgi:hypothetical protein